MILALAMIAQTIILARTETGAPGHVLEVYAEACDGTDRALSARVLIDGRPQTAAPATMPEDWRQLPCDLAARSGGFEGSWQEPSDRERKTLATVMVTDIPLQRGTRGALVSMEGGLEHVHRWHALFVDVSGTARRAWDDGDNLANTWSGATPATGGIDFVWVAKFDERYGPEYGPDVWRGERISWKASKDAAIRSPLRVFATIAGTYSSLAAAREEQRNASDKCRRVRLLALDTNQLRALSPGKFVLAQLSRSEPAARTVLARLTRCGLPAYVKRAQ